jgi:hypothetical protein
MQYESSTWIMPKLWAANTSYNAEQCVSNGAGLIYCTPAGGTSGSSEPVQTSGTASDGGVSWTVFTAGINAPLRDDDTFLFDEDLLELDVVWTFRKLKGLEYRDLEIEANALWDTHFVNQKGASTLRMGRSPSVQMLGYGNLPESGYGS